MSTNIPPNETEMLVDETSETEISLEERLKKIVEEDNKLGVYSGALKHILQAQTTDLLYTHHCQNREELQAKIISGHIPEDTVLEITQLITNITDVDYLKQQAGYYNPDVLLFQDWYHREKYTGNREVVGTLPGEITAVKSPFPGTIFAASTKGNVVRWDLNEEGRYTETPVGQLLNDQVKALQITPEFDIYSCTLGGEIVRWTRDGDKYYQSVVVSNKSTQRSPASCVHVLPKGRIVTGHKDGTVLIWKAKNGIYYPEIVEPDRRRPCNTPINEIKVTPEDDIFVVNSRGDTIIYTPRTHYPLNYGETIWPYSNYPNIKSAILFPNGSLYRIFDNAVSKESPYNGDLVYFQDHETLPDTLHVALDGDVIVTSNNFVYRIDRNQKKDLSISNQPPELLLITDRRIACAQLLNDESLLCGSRDGIVIIIT